MKAKRHWAVLSIACLAACRSAAVDPSPHATGSVAVDVAKGSLGAERESDHHDDSPCGLPAGLAALPGYSISVWARGTSDYSNPDSIEVDGKDIWVGYQNVTAKDGTDGKTSTIVEY